MLAKYTNGERNNALKKYPNSKNYALKGQTLLNYALKCVNSIATKADFVMFNRRHKLLLYLELEIKLIKSRLLIDILILNYLTSD